MKAKMKVSTPENTKRITNHMIAPAPAKMIRDNSPPSVGVLAA
jgi:hypothetical protein